MREVNMGQISLKELVRWLCENPARYFGCYPQKGCIQEGSDADLVIVDLEKPFSMNREALHYPEELEYSVYQGYDTKGSPVSTLRRGEFLLKDGVYNDKASNGVFIKRKL